jgi:signal peptidase I
MRILRAIYAILIDLTETLVIAGAIFVVIYAFLFRPFQVNGQSMYPNYHNGEYILTNLISLKFGTIERGQVIVFESPTDREKDFVKRVIGVPGDDVSIKDGFVYVNNTQLDESSYLATDIRTYGGAFLSEGKVVKVPEKNYLVLGDNRNFSSDSREWGFVPHEKIIGKSFFVYWPVTRMRLVEQGKYPQAR